MMKFQKNHHKMIGNVLLAELPVNHRLRNTPLIEIGAEYKRFDSKIWQAVTPPYGIAKKTYNDLALVWTEWDEWRAINSV